MSWGAGAELRLWGNWTGKLEYLHVDVGGTTNVSQQSAPPSFGPIALTTTTSRIKDDIVRLGLNYRLGPTGAVMASTPTIGFPVKAPVSRTTSGWNWTGPYLGINAGYGVATDQFRQTFTYVTSPFPNPLVGGNTMDSTIAPKGGLLGFQGGYNYQTGSVVVGVEGDWQWADQTATSCGVSCSSRTGPGLLGSASNTFSRYEKVKWLATARGRVGWTPLDGAMIYATGGGAWMGVDEADALSATNTPFFPDAATAASFRGTVSGYVVGAGAELRLWGNWTGKLEYLHVDVGGTATSALHSMPPLIPPLVLATTTGRIRDDIVRLGLNYKLANGLP